MGVSVRWRRRSTAVGAVFLVALAVRLALVMRSGGFLGNYGYDSSVYYAASDALTHGRLPYRDFVFLHPPGLMLALTPAAVLGRLTTDHIGFLGASLGFTVVGAVNAALIVAVANRLAIGATSAIIGGLFYAIWFGSASAEFSDRLEPLGNLLLLLGLYALAGAAERLRQSDVAPTTPLVLGGAALGLAASVKIWFVIPLALATAWVVLERRALKPVGLFVAGAIAAGLVVDGPFLFVARGRMWSMVVTDQLGRPNAKISLDGRLAQLTSLSRLSGHLGPSATRVGLVIVTVAMAAVLTLAWRVRAARLVVILAVAQLATLIAAPSWFGFYADFAAVPVALCVAAGAAALPHRLRVVGWLPTVAAALITAVVLRMASFPATTSWHTAGRLIRIVAPARCVTSNTPGGLIELNVLDRDLARGCPNWIDVTGHTYFGVDRQAGPRTRNRPWQRDLREYLLRGQAVFLVPVHGEGLSAATLRSIEQHGVIGRSGPYRLYRGSAPGSARS